MTKIINQTLYRLGIVFYLLWALIHLLVPFQIFFETAGSMAEGIERGRVEQSAFFMAQIALLTAWSALRGWSDRSRLNFYLTFFLVSWADGFWVFFLVIPGIEPLDQAWPGLFTWFGGALFTSAGFLGERFRKRAST